MNSEVGVGMRFRVIGDFGEPRSGHDDAGGGDVALIQCFEAGGVFGMGDRKVIGVNDEQFCFGGIAEALGYGFGLRGDGAAGCGRQKNGKSNSAKLHGRLPNGEAER